MQHHEEPHQYNDELKKLGFGGLIDLEGIKENFSVPDVFYILL